MGSWSDSTGRSGVKREGGAKAEVGVEVGVRTEVGGKAETDVKVEVGQGWISGVEEDVAVAAWAGVCGAASCDA